MKRNLTEAQKAKKAATILRWAEVKNGENVMTASEIANALIAVNALNTMRRNASDVQVALGYIDTIAVANEFRINNAAIQTIIDKAAKGTISKSDAMTLANFSIENNIEL